MLAVFVVTLINVVLTLPFFILGLVNDDISLVVTSTGSNVSQFRYSTCLIHIFIPQHQEVVVEHCLYSCGTTIFYTLHIGVAAILYKLVLHAIGLFLAFKIRKVQIDVVNDYKYVVVTVCCSTVLILITCVILILTMDQPTISSLLWSCLVFPFICIYLGLTFVPKVNLNRN